MQLKKWQKLLSVEIQKTFPVPFSSEQRLLSIVRQVADASGALLRRQGQKVTKCHNHDDYKYRIALVFVDLFVECTRENIDIEKELQKAVKWFRAHRK